MIEFTDESQQMNVLIASHTVTFIKEEKGSALVCGSGTFIEFNGIRGIITCGHVWKEIESLESIGLCLFPPRRYDHQKYKIDTANLGTVLVEFDSSNQESLGPDLAFIPLDAQIYTNISAISSFKNLSIDINDIDLCYEQFVLSGSVEELTQLEKKENDLTTFSVEGRMIVGSIDRNIDNTKSAARQRVLFKPNPRDRALLLMSSMAGMSGSGLWQFESIQHENGNVSAEICRFAGVAFYETEQPNNGIRNLICHDWQAVSNFLKTF